MQPRRWSMRSRLVLEATPEDDHTIFACLAHHPALPPTHHNTNNNHLAEATTPLFDSITLSVLREFTYVINCSSVLNAHNSLVVTISFQIC